MTEIQKLREEVEDLKKDILIMKLSPVFMGMISAGIGGYYSGRYNVRDKYCMIEEWDKIKKRLKEMNLI